MRPQFDVASDKKARKKRTIVTAIIISIMVPVIIATVSWINHHSTKNMNGVYLLLSLLILGGTIIPFFLVFEKRKPKAREIVMVAMMSALVMVGNQFAHLVGLGAFQPGTALVIIAGISLGPEAGFLVGATARLFINFFAGQGAWTPWQMVCWGIMGFLAGLIFNKVDINKTKSHHFKAVARPIICVMVAMIVAYLSLVLFGEKGESLLGWRLYLFGAIGFVVGLLIQQKRLPIDGITLSVFGFLSTFVIYGGIINIGTMVLSSATPQSGIGFNWEGLKIIYFSGLAHDIPHSLATAFFLLIFGDKVIRKIERAKIKYGMYR